MTHSQSISRAAMLWAALLAGLIFLSVVVVSVLKGQIGQAGPDGDDMARLVQIRDFLAGQGWFDLHQYRLGPNGGTLMHWSRIPDVPILLLTALFDIFLPQETALAWAITVWPPISLLIVLCGLALAVRQVGDGRLLVFAFIVAAPVLFAHFRFLAGAIDHHNIQLGLLAVAVGAFLDPQLGRRSMTLGAVMLALSVAVGIELYPFVAVMCGFIALEWAVRGQAVQGGVITFGAVLASAILLCFVATVPPSAWGRVYCDSLSIISVLALVIGGAGLALCALFLSSRTLAYRLSGLACVGVACGLVFLIQGPQCLANPIDALSPDIRDIWFGNVEEARPMFAQTGGRWPFVAYAMGPSLVALAVSVWSVYRKQDVRTHLLYTALLAMGIVLMLSQVRFFAFAGLLAIVPCAIWAARLHARGQQPGGSRVAYLLPLVLANPALWAFPFLLAFPAASDAGEAEAGCYSEDTLAILNAVPPGMVLSDANSGSWLLGKTRHSVLYANYHRDVDGMSASLAAFGAPLSEVPALLVENQVDYVLLCPGAPENETFQQRRPDGFLARLSGGEVPRWLQPVGPEPASPGAGRLYRFVPED